MTNETEFNVTQSNVLSGTLSSIVSDQTLNTQQLVTYLNSRASHSNDNSTILDLIRDFLNEDGLSQDEYDTLCELSTKDTFFVTNDGTIIFFENIGRNPSDLKLYVGDTEYRGGVGTIHGETENRYFWFFPEGYGPDDIAVIQSYIDNAIISALGSVELYTYMSKIVSASQYNNPSQLSAIITSGLMSTNESISELSNILSSSINQNWTSVTQLITQFINQATDVIKRDVDNDASSDPGYLSFDDIPSMITKDMVISVYDVISSIGSAAMSILSIMGGFTLRTVGSVLTSAYTAITDAIREASTVNIGDGTDTRYCNPLKMEFDNLTGTEASYGSDYDSTWGHHINQIGYTFADRTTSSFIINDYYGSESTASLNDKKCFQAVTYFNLNPDSGFNKYVWNSSGFDPDLSQSYNGEGQILHSSDSGNYNLEAYVGETQSQDFTFQKYLSLHGASLKYDKVMKRDSHDRLLQNMEYLSNHATTTRTQKSELYRALTAAIGNKFLRAIADTYYDMASICKRDVRITNFSTTVTKQIQYPAAKLSVNDVSADFSIDWPLWEDFWTDYYANIEPSTTYTNDEWTVLYDILRYGCFLPTGTYYYGTGSHSVEKLDALNDMLNGQVTFILNRSTTSGSLWYLLTHNNDFVITGKLKIIPIFFIWLFEKVFGYGVQNPGTGSTRQLVAMFNSHILNTTKYDTTSATPYCYLKRNGGWYNPEQTVWAYYLNPVTTQSTFPLESTARLEGASVPTSPLFTPPAYTQSSIILGIVVSGIIIGATAAIAAVASKSWKKCKQKIMVRQEAKLQQVQSDYWSMVNDPNVNKNDLALKEKEYLKLNRRFTLFSNIFGYSSNTIGSLTTTKDFGSSSVNGSSDLISAGSVLSGKNIQAVAIAAKTSSEQGVSIGQALMDQIGVDPYSDTINDKLDQIILLIRGPQTNSVR